MQSNHKQTCYVAAVLLAVAILPLPYGYYVLMRIAVFGIAVFILIEVWQARPVLQEVLILGGVALLFNPIIFVTFSRSIWFPIDLLAAGGLACVPQRSTLSV